MTCPTCGEQMEEVRPNIWVCPVARTEAKTVSDATRVNIREMAEQREEAVPF